MTDSMKALAIIPRSISECTDLAEKLSKSDLLPKEMRGKMPNVLVTIMAGQEMGLSPMASLRNFHVIEGRPVLSADGMVALVLGSGKCVYFRRVQEAADSVTYETMRVGDDQPRRCTWTKQMIKDAGLSAKDNHRLYARQMLAARAKAELARDVYPDVLAGCYTEDETHGWERPAPADVVDAELATPDEAREAELLAAIWAADSTDALKALGEQLKTLPETSKAEMRKRYQTRWEQLTKPTTEPVAVEQPA